MSTTHYIQHSLVSSIFFNFNFFPTFQFPAKSLHITWGQVKEYPHKKPCRSSRLGAGRGANHLTYTVNHQSDYKPGLFHSSLEEHYWSNDWMTDWFIGFIFRCYKSTQQKSQKMSKLTSTGSQGHIFHCDWWIVIHFEVSVFHDPLIADMQTFRLRLTTVKNSKH